MINGQSAGIDGDQWAKVGNVPGLRCDPPQIQGDEGYKGCLILAHGAGAPMDSGFMNEMAQRLAALGVGVIRFEFPYMAERRVNGGKRPPNPQRVLLECWREVYRQVRPLVAGTLAIGGKSMGGRMASLVADELEVDALVCLGYPFYAVGKPEKPRVEHLAELKTPTLIVQGERDALGNREAVAGYALSPAIEVSWQVAGDHDLKPLKASGFSHAQHMQAAAQQVAEFLLK
ncbi:MAG: alpha/beta family hydrolase [Pseudomonas capeferrum]|jgi:predicted alpha/beta-hydrolase family hydrolase|uniref:alpha/beta family hydrolase n=1 Tax=unclassified Pseudomonas TaxID=196821 RepID=UPI00236338E0|nr:alpha/beta family hydrolase [Pseudomonas sp. 39004]MDD1963617.1 dienelactone hydrolase family protein [Pseudomonas sp. 39004]